MLIIFLNKILESVIFSHPCSNRYNHCKCSLSFFLAENYSCCVTSQIKLVKSVIFLLHPRPWVFIYAGKLHWISHGLFGLIWPSLVARLLCYLGFGERKNWEMLVLYNTTQLFYCSFTCQGATCNSNSCNSLSGTCLRCKSRETWQRNDWPAATIRPLFWSLTFCSVSISTVVTLCDVAIANPS